MESIENMQGDNGNAKEENQLLSIIEGKTENQMASSPAKIYATNMRGVQHDFFKNNTQAISQSLDYEANNTDENKGQLPLESEQNFSSNKELLDSKEQREEDLCKKTSVTLGFAIPSLSKETNNNKNKSDYSKKKL